jgi:choline dehydrogenase-like flavoprotein
MAWSRGHKNDWDYFASEAGDLAWSYESVLSIYRRIEDWHGAPDPRHGIPLVQHLPGVGQNFQDHPAIGCIWEYQKPLEPRNNAGEATYFSKSDPSLDTPDIQTCQGEVPLTSAEMLTRFSPPSRFLDDVRRPRTTKESRQSDRRGSGPRSRSG